MKMGAAIGANLVDMEMVCQDLFLFFYFQSLGMGRGGGLKKYHNII